MQGYLTQHISKHIYIIQIWVSAFIWPKYCFHWNLSRTFERTQLCSFRNKIVPMFDISRILPKSNRTRTFAICLAVFAWPLNKAVEPARLIYSTIHTQMSSSSELRLKALQSSKAIAAVWERAQAALIHSMN